MSDNVLSTRGNNYRKLCDTVTQFMLKINRTPSRVSKKKSIETVTMIEIKYHRSKVDYKIVLMFLQINDNTVMSDTILVTRLVMKSETMLLTRLKLSEPLTDRVTMILLTNIVCGMSQNVTNFVTCHKLS